MRNTDVIMRHVAAAHVAVDRAIQALCLGGGLSVQAENMLREIRADLQDLPNREPDWLAAEKAEMELSALRTAYLEE